MTKKPTKDKREIGVEAFLDRFGSEAPEVIWQASLAVLERAVADARAGATSRWRYYPQGEIRRLRGEVAGALMLARFAAALQEDENSMERELVRQARDVAEEQRQKRNREMTTEAERARLRIADRERRREAAS